MLFVFFIYKIDVVGEFIIKEGYFVILKILNVDIKDKIDLLCLLYCIMMLY